MIARQLSRFANVAIALAALLLTVAALHVLLPPMIPVGVTEKLQFFAAHQNEFDTLFLGSSQIYYAVSPEHFDRITGENGVSTRTFNFGIDGLHPPETFYLLDQILKAGPRNLKWVFLELDNIQIKSTVADLGTERLLYWHDWPATALALKKALSPFGDDGWNYDAFQLCLARRELILHLTLLGKHFANLGRAADFFSTPDPGADSSTMKLGPRADGYRLVGAPMSKERAANFQKMMAREVASAHPRLLDAYAEKAYYQWAARIRQCGATPIFLVPPRPAQSPFLFRKTPSPIPVLSFNNCKAYPQLYADGSRVDEGHLSNEAAAEFTRLLALELVRYARQH